MLEEHERKVQALRQALVEGEQSGAAEPYSMEEIIDDVMKEATAGTRDASSQVSTPP